MRAATVLFTRSSPSVVQPGRTMRGGAMRNRIVTCLAAAVVAAIMGGGFPGTSIARNASAHARQPDPCAGYHPVLDPKQFVDVVDNPYFPLPVGRTLVYRGIKDGQSQIDRVKVSR